MALPKFLEVFLPSRYNTSAMDVHNKYDKRVIIEEISNRGKTEHIKWLLKTYGTRELKQVLCDPTRGFWREKKLRYWANRLDVKIPKPLFDAAIFSLRPRPEVFKNYIRYMYKKGKIPKRTLKLWKDLGLSYSFMKDTKKIA